MRRIVVLTVLAAFMLAVPPASTRANTPELAYGKPYSGSYLKTVPSSMRTTKSRVVWVRWSGIYSTWADGGPDWDRVWNNVNMGLSPEITGVAKVLTWEWIDTSASMDFEHPSAGLYYDSGRAKVRLTAGNGRKTVKLRFKLRIVSQHNFVDFVPNFPLSPTFKRTVRLAM